MPFSGVYLFTYMVNTFANAYQLVVKLVVDGVNYSDGISDPFHHFQVIHPNKLSALSRSFQVDEFTFILGASGVIFNYFNSFCDEIPTC